MNRIKCPHCSGILHEHASFCPHCAMNINERIELNPPKPMRKRAITIGVVAVIVLAVALGFYFGTKPRVFDGFGEALYTDRDGTYQLALAWPASRQMGQPVRQNTAELGGDYTFPTRLYINHTDSGADANQVFLKKLESVSVEILQPEDSAIKMSCSEPVPHEYSPDAALVTFINFTGATGSAELVWTFNMQNGDIITLRQTQMIDVIETHVYHYKDTPMETLEELQALIAEIEGSIDPSAVVNLHLPPVTYEGGVIMENRPVNLYGYTEGEGRTVFTGTSRIASGRSNGQGWICYLEDIDFIGDSSGTVGISASGRVWLVDCTVTGWKTGLLGYGYAWVNTWGSLFENNGIGFHFNSIGGSVSDTRFNDNNFINNETGILLENVPTDVTITFFGTRFSGNGKDIDNRCNQSLDISEAVFE